MSRETRLRLIIIAGAFALVMGFVLTMKSLGEDPVDAITLILAIFAAASTIAAGIFAAMGNFKPESSGETTEPKQIVEPKRIEIGSAEPTVASDHGIDVPPEPGRTTDKEVR